MEFQRRGKTLAVSWTQEVYPVWFFFSFFLLHFFFSPNKMFSAISRRALYNVSLTNSSNRVLLWRTQYVGRHPHRLFKLQTASIFNHLQRRRCQLVTRAGGGKKLILTKSIASLLCVPVIASRGCTQLCSSRTCATRCRNRQVERFPYGHVAKVRYYGLARYHCSSRVRRSWPWLPRAHVCHGGDLTRQWICCAELRRALQLVCQPDREKRQRGTKEKVSAEGKKDIFYEY